MSLLIFLVLSGTLAFHCHFTTEVSHEKKSSLQIEFNPSVPVGVENPSPERAGGPDAGRD